jgi:hypothetical protein
MLIKILLHCSKVDLVMVADLVKMFGPTSLNVIINMQLANV